MITGIDKVVFGVEDMVTCARFFRDWGLREVSNEPGRATYATLDGCEVEIRPVDDPELPAPFEPGSTLRRVVWGVDSEGNLDAACERLGRHADISRDEDGPGCADPNGLRLSLRVSRRQEVDVHGSPTNTIDHAARVDERGRIYDRAEPVKVGHVVLFSPDVKAAVSFYETALGFVVSDYYPDAGYFLRCAPNGGHHNLFLLQTPDRKRGLNHVAFTVRDIHEVFGGGLHIARCGWQTQIGPGRHPISSAYFWYVHSPAGGLAEYYADEDYCTADWKAKAWKRSPEHYAEWAIVGGIDGTTRRQADGPES